MDEDFIGGKPKFEFQNPNQKTTTDNIRVFVPGTAEFASIEHIRALETAIKALTERVDRLYSHLGLRG